MCYNRCATFFHNHICIIKSGVHIPTDSAFKAHVFKFNVWIPLPYISLNVTTQCSALLYEHGFFVWIQACAIGRKRLGTSDRGNQIRLFSPAAWGKIPFPSLVSITGEKEMLPSYFPPFLPRFCCGWGRLGCVFSQVDFPQAPSAVSHCCALAASPSWAGSGAKNLPEYPV